MSIMIMLAPSKCAACGKTPGISYKIVGSTVYCITCYRKKFGSK